MRRVKVMCIKKVITLALMLLLIISCSVSAVGATTTTIIYLGSENVNYAGGDVDYDVRGYVYYDSNTSTTLELTGMAQWIYNYGIYPVNEVRFKAHDAAFVNYMESIGYISGITGGEHRRVEIDWEDACASEGKSHIYTKNSVEKFVFTDMVAGYSYSGLGGWSSYWYPTTRDDVFHF